MSEIEIKRKDIIWGYVAQFLNLGVNFLLIPISIKILTPESFGIWQLFVTIYLFLNLMDFGFRPTFIRNIAYVYSGAKTLEKHGFKRGDMLKKPNYPLLKSLSHFIKFFYGWFSIVMFLVAITLGTWYIHSLSDELINYENIMFAWGLYAMAISLSFYVLYYNTLLNGCGFIKEAYQIMAYNKISYFIITAILLYLDFGLAAFGWGMLISTVINLILSFYFLNKVGLSSRIKNAIKNKVNIFSIVSHNAFKVGIVNLAMFFTTRGSLFLASFFLSLQMIGEYGLSIQFVGIMAVFGQLYLQTNIPQLSSYRINNNLEGIRRITGETYVISLIIYFIAGLLLVFLGNPILNLIDSKTFLIDTIPLLLLLIVYLLDMNHNISIQIITTRNEVPHLWACIITGIVITIITFLTLKYTNLGIYAIILSIGITQLFYQNWKWPAYVSKELNTTYLSLLKKGSSSLIGKLSLKY